MTAPAENSAALGTPWRLLFVFVVCALAAGGCKIRTEIDFDIREDGSGSVVVSVGLDDDAISRVPGLEQELRLDDLVATGWEIEGPVREGDGFTWFRATKPFASPEEASLVLAEIAGDDGPFRDFHVTRERSFARSEYGFEGTVDFTGGLEAFGDAELESRLDGEALGEDVAVIEENIGDTVDRVFEFRVAVRLPGDVSSNAPGQAANGAVWEPRMSDAGPVHLEASSTSWRAATLVWVGVGLFALLALLVLLLVRLATRSLHRTRDGSAADLP